MRRLILLRHAKAVAKLGDDRARALADRGRDDMQLIAEALADPGLRPDLALVSPAARTRETWALSGLDGVPTRFEEAIYEAVPDTLLDLARGAPDDVGTLVMVGHNPGFEELALSLAGAGAKPLRAGMPTAAFAILEFADANRWATIGPGAARLARFVRPADLGGGPDA